MPTDEAEIRGREQCEDQGYFGSQEDSNMSTKVSLKSSEDENLVQNYFTESPNLQDLSFHVMCADASGFPDSLNEFPFEHL